MNITLINPKLENKYPQPPLGLLSLATVLKNNKHNVQLWDQNLVGRDYLPLSDVYGFSIVSAAYKQAKEWINLTNKHNRMIVGGAHPSALPEAVWNETEADALVMGEGETAILEALEHDGIIKHEPIADLDNLPVLDYGMLDWPKYHPHPPHGKHQPFIPMVTSRGCPFSCVFCAKSVFGKKYRAFSANRIVYEIEYLLLRYGVREIAFYDDVFTLNRQRVLDICNQLLARGIKIAWSCETRVDLVDRDLLEAMKSAGCFSVAFGVESGTKKILDYLNKGVEYWQVYKAVKDAQQLGLETVGYFMFVPDMETDETIGETIQLARRLNMDFVQFSKMIPLPGSQIYKGGNGADSYVTFGNGAKDKIDVAQHRAYKAYYMNLNYVMNRALKSMRSFGDFKMTLRGLRMLYGG